MMQHRKRTTLPTFNNGNDSHNNNANGKNCNANQSGENKFHNRNYGGKHATIITVFLTRILPKPLSIILSKNPTVTRMATIVTLACIVYSISFSSTSLDHGLHNPTNIVGTLGNIPGQYLPQRARVVGYYSETAHTGSPTYYRVENLDHSNSKVYVPKPTKEDEDDNDWKKKKRKKRSKDSGHADVFERGDCVAQYEWQKTSFPTCNLLQEQNLIPHYDSKQESLLASSSNEKNYTKYGADENIRLIANGYWRDVWKLRNNNLGFSVDNGKDKAPTSDSEEKAVIKTIRYEHEYTERNYDRHRRDAVAMERLTASDYVMNIYGYCANSGIFEYADGGSIDDSLFYSSVKESDWSSKERLIVAYQVAKGISDMHNFAKDGVPSMAHTDITGSQFVYVSTTGIYKLNDFNRARFLTINKKTQQVCPYHVSNNPGTVSF